MQQHYKSNTELPEGVRKAIPSARGQHIFRNALNAAFADSLNEYVAFASGWNSIEKAGYLLQNSGEWALPAVADDINVTRKAEDGHVPPELVRNNARRALEVRQTKPESQRGMTAVGIARARDLSNGKALSLATVKRMVAYFERHQKDKQGSTWKEQGKGWQAWMGWGGDAGWSWARKIVDASKKETTTTAKADTSSTFTAVSTVAKVDEEKRIVFGWASVVEKGGVPVVDSEGDVILPDELEASAYVFSMQSRAAKLNHTGGSVGELVETMVFTKDKQQALGIDLGLIGWWVGFKIHDDAVWEQVKSGELKSFSIGGRGTRQALESEG